MRTRCLHCVPIGFLAIAISLFDVIWLGQVQAEVAPLQSEQEFHPYEEVIPIKAPGLAPPTDQQILPDPGFQERFDYWFRRHPSLNLIRSPQMSPTGFGLPGGRGRSGHYTRVYLDGMLLDDPLTGWPLVEDLDLRFFDRVSLSLGLADRVELPTSSILTLDLSLEPPLADRTRLGLQGGNVYGQSLWAVHDFQGEAGFVRSYLRQHTAHGAYSVYDDGLTPSNPDDDGEGTLTHNHQSSWQVIEGAHLHWSDWQLNILARSVHKSFGIPPPHVQLKSTAHGRTQADLLLARITKSSPGQSLIWGGQAGLRRDLLSTFDQSGTVLVYGPEEIRSSFGRQAGLDLKYNLNDSLTLYNVATAKNAQVAIDHPEGKIVQGHRRSHEGRTALEFQVGQQDILLKSEWLQIDDSLSQATSSQGYGVPESQSYHLQSTSLMIRGSAIATSYFVSLSREQVPPSLLAKFGDGRGSVATQSLNPEIIQHQEWGLARSWHGTLARHLSFRWFRDRVKDKIISIPVALGRNKSINLDQSAFVGQEWQLNLQWQSWLATSSLTVIQAHDPQGYRVPNLAQRYFSQEWRYQKRQWSAFLLGRYQDDLYFDQHNDQMLPGHWQWQTGITLSLTDPQLYVTLEIFNLCDLKRLAYQTPQDRGYIAYADRQGAPLPGRHGMLSVETRIP